MESSNDIDEQKRAKNGALGNSAGHFFSRSDL